MRNDNSTRHYYGFYWTYSIGTWWVENDGTSYPCGSVHVFASREARDEWVASEPYDGSNYHRSGMDARTAVAEMRRCVRESWQCRYPEDVAVYSVARLVDAYESLEA